MSVAINLTYTSVEDYLAAEETSLVRHEYVDGQVFVMAGANRRHNLVAGNIFNALHNFLEGTPCRAFMEAFKAHIKTANCFYYPDVMVACGDADDDSVYTEEPTVIVEVLSPSTAAIDRREKLVNYLKIPTLSEYLIVHQRRKRVELYQRNPDGTWDMTEFVTGDRFTLKSLPNGKLTISIDSIYRNTSTKDGALGVQEEIEDEYCLSAAEADALDW